MKTADVLSRLARSTASAGISFWNGDILTITGDEKNEMRTKLSVGEKSNKLGL